jgi:muramoyltetrapeptide carboxypeptidase
MASYDFGGLVDPYTESRFWQAMHDATVDVAFDTTNADRHDVEGTLWGGNLAMLCSLLGTPWMPVVDGGILFVEDINEQPYRIERMLFQLQQAGVLDRQKMLLCGDFSGFRVAPYDNGYGIVEALAAVRSTTRVPFVTGLPFGHVPTKATLAVGAVAHVEVADGRVRLRQHWDLSRG